MDYKKRERTIRKEFWIPFIVFVIPIIIVIGIYGDISSELFFFLIFIVAGLYIAGYINGFRQGKEAIRQVLDYMNPSLRWKVLDAETKMYDEEDQKYRENEKSVLSKDDIK